MSENVSVDPTNENSNSCSFIRNGLVHLMDDTTHNLLPVIDELVNSDHFKVFNSILELSKIITDAEKINEIVTNYDELQIHRIVECYKKFNIDLTKFASKDCSTVFMDGIISLIGFGVDLSTINIIGLQSCEQRLKAVLGLAVSTHDPYFVYTTPILRAKINFMINTTIPDDVALAVYEHHNKFNIEKLKIVENTDFNKRYKYFLFEDVLCKNTLLQYVEMASYNFDIWPIIDSISSNVSYTEASYFIPAIYELIFTNAYRNDCAGVVDLYTIINSGCVQYYHYIPYIAKTTGSFKSACDVVRSLIDNMGESKAYKIIDCSYKYNRNLADLVPIITKMTKRQKTAVYCIWDDDINVFSIIDPEYSGEIIEKLAFILTMGYSIDCINPKEFNNPDIPPDNIVVAVIAYSQGIDIRDMAKTTEFVPLYKEYLRLKAEKRPNESREIFTWNHVDKTWQPVDKETKSKIAEIEGTNLKEKENED